MGFFRSVWTWLRRRRDDDIVAEDTAPDEVRTVLLEPAAPTRPTLHPEPEDGFPGFRASAADRPANRAPGLSEARLALNEAFTPAQPVTERKRFAGRLEVLVQLISALEDQRGHVVLYGERGIGKTSLVHVLAEIARDSRYHVAYASCGSGSRFDDIFRGVLRDIPLLYTSQIDPATSQISPGSSLADLLPQGSFDARQLGDVCATITGTRVLIILDEYDRTEDAQFRQHIAELVKNLSDRAARVQLVIAGVAGNLQELVGYIPSIRRNIIGLPVPRLERREVEALIGLGERAAGMSFTPAAIEMVDMLCHGSPYLARLLCHRAGLSAINAGRLAVDLDDIRQGLDEIVTEAENRLGPLARARVQEVLAPGHEPLLAGVALAASTPDGSLDAADVRAALTCPQADAAIVGELTRLEGLGLLVRVTGEGSGRFRFGDEALPFFLWMALARQGFPGGSANGSAGGSTRQAA